MATLLRLIILFVATFLVLQLFWRRRIRHARNYLWYYNKLIPIIVVIIVEKLTARHKYYQNLRTRDYRELP